MSAQPIREGNQISPKPAVDVLWSTLSEFSCLLEALDDLGNRLITEFSESEGTADLLALPELIAARGNTLIADAETALRAVEAQLKKRTVDKKGGKP